jgi:hypothetical protein
MDSIAPINSSTYVSVASSQSSQPPVAPNTPVADSISLSGVDASNLAGIYAAPDPTFAALLQSDAGLAQDFAISSQAQFGFDDTVLATDDTLPAAAQTATTPLGDSSTDSVAVAQKVALGALSFEGGVAGALFGAQSSAEPSTLFFMGSSMNSLLTANGTAALAYLTPQAASAGASVNASA